MATKSVVPNSPKHRDIPLTAQLYRLVLLEGDRAPTDEALAAIRSIKIAEDGHGGVRFALTIDNEEAEIIFDSDGSISLYWLT